MRNSKVQTMAIAALLCAMGIIIPMFAPKIMLEPASYTLASHVPVFIAMFISPPVAISVALISAFGFLMSGFPIIIVLRALTHVVFAGIGGFVLYKNKNILHNKGTLALFTFLISVVHAVCEVLVVTPFYMSSSMADGYYQKGYILTVFGLVGVGTVIHSIIDFCIAYVVWKPICNVVHIPVSFRFKKN